MREIKFRAWIKEDEIMTYFEDESYILNGDMSVDAFDYEKRDCENYFEPCYKTVDVELMQFTGLYDKNGKEIYEGDILQQVHYVFSNDEYDHKGFKKFIIQVLWGQKEAAFIFKVIKEIDIEMPKDYKEPYREVIGNIYENVDLLKGADNIE